MDKETILAWLDKIIDNLQQLKATQTELEDQGIECINHMGYIHLCGLEKVANIIGATVTYNPNFNDEYGQMTFYYKDYEVSQLWLKEKKHE